MSEWRAVVGYEGLYEVSDDGRVRGVERTEVVVIPGRTDARRPREGREVALDVDRYTTVHLSKNGRARRHGVHRLVLEAFEGPCPDGHEAAHEDGDTSHNWRENLRWKTHADNDADKDRHGTRAKGEGNGRAKLTEEQARAVLASKASARALARELGVSRSTIRLIRNGKNWRHLQESV